MTKSATKLSKQFLACDGDALEDLRIHQFRSDEEAHDDSAINNLYAEFIADFKQVQAELSASYGEPTRQGSSHDKDIPLSGVFRFAIWDVEGRLLYAAVAHEDRECPILLLLGAVSR